MMRTRRMLSCLLVGLALGTFSAAAQTGPFPVQNETLGCTDNDDDGFCGSGDPVADDCDDSSAIVSPGQPEVCSDGINNDCDSSVDETDCTSTALIGPRSRHIYTLRLPPGECPHPNPQFTECFDTGDTLPVGPGIFYVFATFDTGSTVVLINNDGDEWSINHADLLDLCAPDGPCATPPLFLPERLDVRLWGLDRVDPGSLAAPLDFPEAEVEDVRVRPASTPTLIGAPVAGRVVAHIDYRTTIARTFAFGTVTGPDMTFFGPGDAAIPVPLFDVALERRGDFGSSLSDGASTGPRYLVREARFHDAGFAASDAGFGILLDTGNTTTQVNVLVAQALGIDPDVDPPDATLVVNTVDGQVALKGYVIDRFELTGTGGIRSYSLDHPLVFVTPPRPGLPPEATFTIGVDAVLGTNYFARAEILFDGPGDTLGFFQDSAGDVDQDAVPDGQDTCVYVSNSAQVDSDGDGLGDACDGGCHQAVIGLLSDLRGDRGFRGADCFGEFVQPQAAITAFEALQPPSPGDGFYYLSRNQCTGERFGNDDLDGRVVCPVRCTTSVSLDSADYGCSGELEATVFECDEAVDLGANLTPASVAGRTLFEVVNAGGVLLDLEHGSNLGFTQPDPAALVFVSNPILVSSGTVYDPDNGVLDVRDGDRIRVRYEDRVSGVPDPPRFRAVEADVNCSFLDAVGRGSRQRIDKPRGWEDR